MKIAFNKREMRLFIETVYLEILKAHQFQPEFVISNVLNQFKTTTCNNLQFYNQLKSKYEMHFPILYLSSLWD